MRVADIDYLRGFLKQKSGLVLTPDKTYLLENRLQPLVRSYDVDGIEQLAELLRAGTRPEIGRAIVEAMTTNESFFFRDIKPFDMFRDNVLPRLLSARGPGTTIRIWSAAASTGQEPYSLAMLLKESEHRLGGWRFEIVATDIDTDVLARAKAGLYTQFEVQRGLPVQLLVKYFEKAGDKWQIVEPLRRRVAFRPHNLLDGAAGLGRFDIVFCRNVLIYFDTETKARALADVARMLAPDGYLFLGGAETVLGISDRFTPVEGMRGVYAPLGGETPAAAKPVPGGGEQPAPAGEAGAALAGLARAGYAAG